MKRACSVTVSALAALTLFPSVPASYAQEGEIVAERGYSGFKEPWLLWDEASCSFKPTDDHPADYSGTAQGWRRRPAHRLFIRRHDASGAEDDQR